MRMRYVCKYLLAGLAALFLCVTGTRAQQYQFTAPDCEFSFRYAVVGGVISPQPAPLGGTRVPASADVSTQAGYDNRYKNCVSWTMLYHVDGPGALSIELDEAPTSAGIPGSWVTWPTAFTAPGTTQPLTTLVSSQVTTFAYFPWVSVILNSATGSGQVEGHVYGWRAAPGQDASVTGVSVVPVTTDPCQSSSISKAGVAINISTAATTQLVAPVAGKTVFVCSFVFTISQVVTTANTLQFTTGTGATCGTGTVNQTGLFGAGGVTAAAPIVVASGEGATIFSGASGAGACAVTAIGASGSFQGVLTFVQK